MRWRRTIAAVFIGTVFSGLAGALFADLVVGYLQEVAAAAFPGPGGAEVYALTVDSLTLAVCAVPGVLVAVLIAATGRKPRPGHCQGCGYDLTGNTSGRCSECGEVYQEKGPPQQRSDP